MNTHSATHLLEQAARNFGDRSAISDGTVDLTYTEYRSLARLIAAGLLRAGSSRRPVAVYLPKSTVMLAAMMGVAYSGSPYVPVDAGAPLARLRRILGSVRPGIILTDEAHRDILAGEELGDSKVCLLSELMAGEPDEDAVERANGLVLDSDPVYILYTSGSTGTPKGVTIPHRGVLAFAQWIVDTFHYDENTVMANQAPFYFDNSDFDIYGSLKCGGRLLIIPESLLLFPGKLPQFLLDNHVTSIFWVPTVMINVANSGVLSQIDLPELKTVAFAGEAMPNLQLNVWRKALPGRVFANLYGPTEITDICTYYLVDREFADSDPLPIGKACEHAKILILTEDNKEAAVGQQGEICVIGTGVALGYWNEPGLTEKVFVPNPLNSNWKETMYRTGDLGSFTEDGLILYQGRMDNQIKLKGNRIELGEIEAAAVCIPGVQNACAIFDSDRQEIVLFVESREEFRLRKFNVELRKYIPGYMLPARLITMETLPHTANDKIDRVTLKKSL